MSEENKKVAIAFYEKALNDRDVETAFRLYAGEYYRQHNPLVKGNHDVIVHTVNSIYLVQNMPNAKLILYPDANHGSWYQNHEPSFSRRTAFWTRATEFLRLWRVSRPTERVERRLDIVPDGRSVRLN